MKLCPECSASHDISAVLCSACGAVIEEPFYLRSIGFCAVLGGLLLFGAYYTVRLLTSGGVMELLRPELSSPQAIFLTLRAWVVVSMSLVGYGLALCIVRSQGLAFFDFRIEHTWREGAPGSVTGRR